MNKLENTSIIKTIKALVLSLTLFSCSTNAINTTALNNSQSQNNVINSSGFKYNNNFKFGVKFAPSFNPEAYKLAWGDIRLAIKNKSIPDAVYHYTYSQTGEPQRFTDSNYLQIKSRIESGEWSEEAYLIANPDVEAAINTGTLASGYAHWYGYAITSEPSRITSTAYTQAKAATDLGFSEDAYRLAYPDVDSAIKSSSLASAYAHWNTHAKNNETSRLSDPRYIKIITALDYGFDEKAYRLAYPDVDSSIKSGSIPSALFHYINYGIAENRLETLVYQDAKLAIINDFDEQRYRTAYPDVVAKIHNPSGGFASGFQHFSLYGKHEGRLKSQAYLDTKYPEIRVNTYTTGSQTNPKIAVSSNGNYIVSWNGSGSGDVTGVYARVYNSQNQPTTGDFLVNNIVSGPQQVSSIATDSSGNFVITWTGEGAGDSSGIYARLYNSSGVAQTSQFLVNTYTTAAQNAPTVSMSSSTGNFVISWRSDQDGANIYAQRYNSSGTPQGSEFLVNTYTLNGQINPSVAMSANGDFVISWQSSNQDGDGYGIYAQRYNSDGTKPSTNGSEFKVNSTTSDAQTFASVAINSTGDFVITWNSNSQGFNFNEIYGQRYDSSGQPVNSEFKINDYVSGAQIQGLSAVSMDSIGNFVVTWSGQGGADTTGIYAKKYNNQGVSQGSEFLVNTYTTDNQSASAISMDSLGNFAITWVSLLQDGSGNGVYAKKYGVQ